MTLLIPPGFAQASFRLALLGDPEEMITTVGISTAPNPQSVADELVAWFIATFPVNTLGTEYTFRGVTLRVGQDGGPPAIVEAPAVHTGTASNGTLPNNCAYLVRKQTGLGGRTGRGRMFWPCFIGSEEEINQRGMLSNVAMADLSDRFESLHDVGGLFLLHDSESPGPGTPTAITALVLDTRIATQRRRLR